MLCYHKNHFILVYYLNHPGLYIYIESYVQNIYNIQYIFILFLYLYRFENFKSTTNPWIGKIEGRIIIGTSGQSIEDIIKVTGETDISPLEWLEKSLLWRHMCPTAPDTLLACPYYEKDLFIIKKCPDIYFIGNTDKFETKLWKGL